MAESELPEVVARLEQSVQEMQAQVRELDENLTFLMEDVRQAKVPRQRGGGDVTETPVPQRDTDTY